VALPEDWPLRGIAMVAAGRTGDRRALRPLSRTLRSGDAWDASRAAIGLGWLGRTAARCALAAALRHEDPFVRIPACWALGRLGGHRRLARRLDDPDDRVRAAAAVARLRNGLLAEPPLSFCAEQLSVPLDEEDMDRALEEAQALLAVREDAALRAAVERREAARRRIFGGG